MLCEHIEQLIVNVVVDRCFTLKTIYNKLESDLGVSEADREHFFEVFTKRFFSVAYSFCIELLHKVVDLLLRKV
jgi:hypothetical protein